MSSPLRTRNVFRDDLFAGKVALVTGGGSGIGLGISETLSSLGANLAILSRDRDRLATASESIAGSFGNVCLPLPADVRRPEEVEAAVKKTVEEFGKIDFLINAAAGNFICAAAELSPNGFGAVIDIDTKGTWNVSRAVFLAGMKDRGGSILNISATLHYGATPGQLHVSAAKAAVDALTKNLAAEWGPLGIRVNAIAPGPIVDTEGARRLFPGEAGERLRRRVPSRRLGLIADVADLSVFVLSEAGSNLNGAILVSDGGLSLLGSWSLAPDVD